MLHKHLTGEIIGAAMEVHNTLRPGLDEKLYENALIIELRSRGRVVDQQSRFPVHYKGHLIGTLIPDMIVDNLIVVDAKVVTDFNDAHMAQMLGYLNITNLEIGMFFSFRHAKLEWLRIKRPDKNLRDAERGRQE